MNPLPERYARYYLENAPSLVWLVVVNVTFTVLGARFYVDRGLADISTFLWLFFADSPTATAIGALSLVTLWAHVGEPIEDFPRNRVLAYLHTFAFVWLVKYGLWTAVALNVGFSAYFPEAYGYFGVIVSHLAFVAEALLIPYYGATTRGALAAALGLLLLNDLLDYGLGYHPPLRYEPGLLLAVATVALSVFAVGLAARLFPRLGAQNRL
ncbi:DUF1405 domain-containing protein [Natronomonas sp. EA1]|uniref:DUF1405 domain-containing protein n=1 Tax=Natronomonas sp. EA1 TaxID=3421655 RepID=UPI003EB8967C